MIKMTDLLNEGKLVSGDYVTVISGKFKGERGTVDRTSTNGNNVLVKLTSGVKGFTADELTTGKVKESKAPVNEATAHAVRDRLIGTSLKKLTNKITSTINQMDTSELTADKMAQVEAEFKKFEATIIKLLK